MGLSQQEIHTHETIQVSEFPFSRKIQPLKYCQIKIGKCKQAKACQEINREKKDAEGQEINVSSIAFFQPKANSISAIALSKLLEVTRGKECRKPLFSTLPYKPYLLYATL